MVTDDALKSGLYQLAETYPLFAPPDDQDEWEEDEQIGPDAGARKFLAWRSALDVCPELTDGDFQTGIAKAAAEIESPYGPQPAVVIRHARHARALRLEQRERDETAAFLLPRPDPVATWSPDWKERDREVFQRALRAARAERAQREAARGR